MPTLSPEALAINNSTTMTPQQQQAAFKSLNASGGTYSPTVVTDANIYDNKMGALDSKASQYTGSIGSIGANTGVTTTGNNASVGAGTGNNENAKNVDYSNMSYQDIYNSVLGGENAKPIDPTVQAELDLIKGNMSSNDALTNSLVSSIQQKYQSRYADTVAQQKASTAGYEQALNLGGSSRYAPISSGGILSSKEKFDLQTLSDLQATENTQIAQLRKDQANQDYQSMSKQLELLDKTRQQKIDLATNIANNMSSVNKENRTRLNNAIDDASKTALANGAPTSVITAIKNAKSSSEAYAAASGYGGGANIDVQKVTNPDGSQSIVRVDKNTRKIMGTTNIGGGTPIGSGSSLTPTDYSKFVTGLTPEGASNFAKLSPVDQSNVSQLINGDALLSDLMASRGLAGSTQRQALLDKARAVDPTFSENTNKQRYDFKQKWNNPNTGVGKVNNSINTALGHLADTKLSSDSLDNAGVKFVNKASNWIDIQTGNSSVLKLKADLTALATEVATIYKGGTQPSESEINDWKQVFSADYSKGQMSAVENEVSKLLTSKITASRYQYKTVMGKELPTSIIDPDKKQALIDAGIDPKNIATENVPGQPKTGIAGQIDTARSQGYTDDQTLEHLKSMPEYADKIQQALSAGWKASDILNFLGSQ